MPERFSDTGRRTFIISQDGQVRSPAPVANVNAWWGGAPSAGLSGSAVLLLAGMTDFNGAIAVPGNWSRPTGMIRVAPAPEPYPVLSK
jgi:hypothetical protein